MGSPSGDHGGRACDRSWGEMRTRFGGSSWTGCAETSSWILRGSVSSLAGSIAGGVNVLAMATVVEVDLAVWYCRRAEVARQNFHCGVSEWKTALARLSATRSIDHLCRASHYETNTKSEHGGSNQ